MMYHSERDWRREEQKKLSLQSTDFGTGASGNVQPVIGDFTISMAAEERSSGMAGWPRHAVAKE